MALSFIHFFSLETPINIFVIYSRADEDVKRGEIKPIAYLKTFLAPLLRKGTAYIWTDGEIQAGTDWDNSIRQNLKLADIYLLLVSPDFLASNYIHDVELAEARKRHENSEAIIVPIILKPCLWKHTFLKDIQGLPQDMKPITTWRNEDGYANAAEGIADLIIRLEEKRKAEKEEHKKAEEKRLEAEREAAQKEYLHQQNLQRFHTLLNEAQCFYEEENYETAQIIIQEALCLFPKDVQAIDLANKIRHRFKEQVYQVNLQRSQTLLEDVRRFCGEVLKTIIFVFDIFDTKTTNLARNIDKKIDDEIEKWDKERILTWVKKGALLLPIIAVILVGGIFSRNYMLYDYVDYRILFSDGLVIVMKNEKYGFINKIGKEVTPMEYEIIIPCDRKWELCPAETTIDHKKTKVVIPWDDDYKMYQFFFDELGYVKKNGKWGVIDKTGKVVIPFEYETCGHFSDGLAKVQKNGKRFYINKKGEYVKDVE